MARNGTDETLDALLTGTLKARGATLGEKLTSVRRKLPRRLAREADEIVAAETRAKYRPDLPPIGDARLKKVRSDIERHLANTDTRGERAAARKRWAAGLALNLLLAMVAIGLFFWFGRQL